MEILIEKTVHGVKHISFNPTPKMRLFAYAVSCDKEYIGREDKLVLKALGLPANSTRSWRNDFNPYFDEWLEEIQCMFRGNNIKKMLEFVGLEKAFRGDFQFWKPFAIRERVISPDQLNHGLALPATLGAYADWSPEKVEQHRNSLLGNLRALENQGTDIIPGEAGSGGAEVHPRGVIDLLEEPVALAEGLGIDGERALQDLGDL